MRQPSELAAICGPEEAAALVDAHVSNAQKAQLVAISGACGISGSLGARITKSRLSPLHLYRNEFIALDRAANRMFNIVSDDYWARVRFKYRASTKQRRGFFELKAFCINAFGVKTDAITEARALPTTARNSTSTEIVASTACTPRQGQRIGSAVVLPPVSASCIASRVVDADSVRSSGVLVSMADATLDIGMVTPEVMNANLRGKGGLRGLAASFNALVSRPGKDAMKLSPKLFKCKDRQVPCGPVCGHRYSAWSQREMQSTIG